jgi:hypothetical protein
MVSKFPLPFILALFQIPLLPILGLSYIWHVLLPVQEFCLFIEVITYELAVAEVASLTEQNYPLDKKQPHSVPVSFVMGSTLSVNTHNKMAAKRALIKQRKFLGRIIKCKFASNEFGKLIHLEPVGLNNLYHANDQFIICKFRMYRELRDTVLFAT